MEASTAKAYPDFGGSTSEKTSGAASVSSLYYLRQFVARAMVVVHAISPELAQHHVSRMDDTELLERFRQYAGVELSADEAQTRAGQRCFHPVACDLATYTGRSAALNPAPPSRRARTRKLPGMEKNATGSDGRGEVCPGGKGF